MEEKYHLNSMEFRDEKLYMGCAEGYWIYNLKTAEKKHIIQLALSKSRFLTTDVNALVFDRQGGMWIGTENEDCFIRNHILRLSISMDGMTRSPCDTIC